MIDLHATFEKHSDEYLKFERVENKLHSRPDICAFLLIDKLLPNPGRDIVRASEHDEFYIDCDCEKLAAIATEHDIITLARCGVMYDESLDSLSIFA